MQLLGEQTAKLQHAAAIERDAAQKREDSVPVEAPRASQQDVIEARRLGAHSTGLVLRWRTKGVARKSSPKLVPSALTAPFVVSAVPLATRT